MHSLKNARNQLIFLSVFLLAISVILVSLHFGGYLLPLEGGVYMGFYTALLAWLASILAIAANIGLAFLIIIRQQSRSLTEIVKKNMKIFSLSVVLLIVILLLVQFSTPYLVYVERGIGDGVAPPILLSLAPSLSILAMVGLIIYALRVLVPQQAKIEQQGHRPQAASTGRTDLQVIEQDESKQPSTQGQVSSAELALVGSIIDPQDVARLISGAQPADEIYTRDEIQTRKNIAEWIMSSVKGTGHVAKTKLEAEFEKQFPPTYVPLFNSVLYDLVYQDKLEVVKEGGRMMVGIPKKSEGNSINKNSS